MHNIENKCKNFKNAGTFIYFAKSSLQISLHSHKSLMTLFDDDYSMPILTL